MNTCILAPSSPRFAQSRGTFVSPVSHSPVTMGHKMAIDFGIWQILSHEDSSGGGTVRNRHFHPDFD